MADYALSSYTSPAQSASLSSASALTFGSDIGSTTPSLVLAVDITTPLSVSGVLALGPTIEDVEIELVCAEVGISESLSVATGGGGPAVPSTGQIYPLGYQ